MQGGIHPTERFRAQTIRLKSKDGWYKEMMVPGLEYRINVPEIVESYSEWQRIHSERRVWSQISANVITRGFYLDCYREGMWEYRERD